MNVILLDKVDNLGALGDKVKVKPGYGRNFLIPTGRAVAATAANSVKFDARRAELERISSDALTAAQSRADALTGLPMVTIVSKAGEEGKLFGSVGAGDIAAAFTQAGVEVDKHEIRLAHGPLRQVGEHDITIHVHSEINAQVKIAVVAES